MILLKQRTFTGNRYNPSCVLKSDQSIGTFIVKNAVDTYLLRIDGYIHTITFVNQQKCHLKFFKLTQLPFMKA